MELSDFNIGIDFFMLHKNGVQPYRCTDIGTRVVVAHKLNHPEDESWYNGPPFAVAELVIDEDDMNICDIDKDNL